MDCVYLFYIITYAWLMLYMYMYNCVFLILAADNSSDIEDEFARGLGQMPSLDYLIDDDPLNSP